ncbi:trimeric intracellular cation channel family protein [Sediminibacterium roseum]|uniref:Trimeric intracellular cation channel family protein n=1 Tax=Sediminibacterium roseum TaxID=1978412 RepID=A0ABW9ZPG5_9BACT|nr:trimeric intracellular cation channel family protein [Sediminibacterium roseum]NCI48978.1 trimeric intracellular cation channel family protein [Sediminibacterium roseum]
MNLIQIIMYVGIFVFAGTGALKARTHHMDIFGGLVIAFATAYGGGTIRDLLIGVHPVNWVNDYLALGLVVSATIIVSFFDSDQIRFKRTIFFTDAIGLGMFTAAGIEISINNNINDGYAVVMGVITATFGGLLADVLCREKPNLLKRGELYATVCAIGGVIYILLKHLGIEKNLGLFICVCIVVSIRILSKRKRIMLPEI